MRRLAWVFALAPLAAVPAAGQFQPLPPQPPGFAQPGYPQYPGQPQPLPYTPPRPDGAVVELLDENLDPLFQHLNNDFTNTNGGIAREDRDVYAGVEAARVTGLHRFRSALPGWSFRVVENPRNYGEYRFLRFAWKKVGGTGIMIQLYTPNAPEWNTRFFSARSWDQRFYAGKNPAGFLPARQVAEAPPGEWELVTRDLYKEFGAFTLTGLSLTAADGTAALFDHVLLGRSVDELNKATDAAAGRMKPPGSIGGKARDALWADLTGTDPKKAAAAQRMFLMTAPDHVGYIRDRLGDDRAKDYADVIPQLVRDLDDENFDVRDRATDELIRIGPPAVAAVQDAGRAAANDEVKYRVRVILKKLGVTPVTAGPPGPSQTARLARAVRVLERAGAPARDLLTDIADGKLAPELAPDARAALVRLSK